MLHFLFSHAYTNIIKSYQIEKTYFFDLKVVISHSWIVDECYLVFIQCIVALNFGLEKGNDLLTFIIFCEDRYCKVWRSDWFCFIIVES